ncbi:MAG: aminopeptidase P family N-terminal domain-containing protein, partial [Pseudomonadota bacterium]
MLQNFAASTSPDTVASRVEALRRTFDAAGVDGFVVPRADVHMGEFVAARDERLAWLTSFTGSAGFAVVLRHAAALFIDGRYTLQARAQSDTDVFDLRAIPKDTLGDYLATSLDKGAVIGFDPRLHGKAEIDRLTQRLDKAELTLKRVDNLIDHIWENQPAPPMGQVVPHPLEMAGRSHGDKRVEIGAAVTAAGADAAVLTLPESLAWLLNIRGADLARTPSVHGFGLLGADGHLTFFCAPEKLDDAAREHLGNGVSITPPDQFADHLRSLTGTVLLDKTSAPLWVADQIDTAEIIWGRDPCILPKACKSSAELEGTRAAHLRDGAAVARFLCWLDQEGPKGALTEIDVVRALEDFRRDTGALKDIAFETICG